MAISVCSPAYQQVNDSDGTLSSSITIPSDCDFLLVGFMGYDSAQRTISTFTIGGSAMSNIVSSARGYEQIFLYGKAAPPTGSQTLAISTGGAWSYGGSALCVFLKGVVGTSYTRDLEEAVNDTLTFNHTSVSGDFGVIIGAGASCDVDVESQTKIVESAAYNSMVASAAYKAATGTTLTMGCNGSTQWAAGVVLIPAAAGGSSIVPLLLHQYRARRQ